jgi:RHS repeat-associated protein
VQVFQQGQYQSGSAYFYTRDHLGSIREMTDSSGTIVARYDYDPWGRVNTVIGTNKPDLNFTGLYNHAKSGLDMATYRVYDPDLGRWLSRDPVGESGGTNLFAYVQNGPDMLSDLSGLKADILVFRQGPKTQASVITFVNDVYIGATFANTSGFYDKSHPPPDGDYTLLPRADATDKDKFASGTPRIVDLDFVHPTSKSKGCLTVPLDWADRIWDIVQNNLNDGGTTIHYQTRTWPVAIPVDPQLPQPTQHVWPVFNLRPGGYPFSYPYPPGS